MTSVVVQAHLERPNQAGRTVPPTSTSTTGRQSTGGGQQQPPTTGSRRQPAGSRPAGAGGAPQVSLQQLYTNMMMATQASALQGANSPTVEQFLNNLDMDHSFGEGRPLHAESPPCQLSRAFFLTN